MIHPCKRLSFLYIKRKLQFIKEQRRHCTHLVPEPPGLPGLQRPPSTGCIPEYARVQPII